MKIILADNYSMGTKANREILWLDAYAIRHPRARAFLLAYAECGNISRAADAADIVRDTHYQWLASPPDGCDYPAAFLEARRRSVEHLEQAAYDRAVNGFKRPVFQKGVKVGEETLYSDALLTTLLKANDRAKYGDKQEITGPGGGPLILATLSADELDARIARLLGSAPSGIPGQAGDAPRLAAPGAAQGLGFQAPADAPSQVDAPQGVARVQKKIEPGPMPAGGVPSPQDADGSHPPLTK